MALVGCASSLHRPQRLALPARQSLAQLGRVCSAGMIAMIESEDVDHGDGDGDGDDDDEDDDDSDDSDE